MEPTTGPAWASEAPCASTSHWIKTGQRDHGHPLWWLEPLNTIAQTEPVPTMMLALQREMKQLRPMVLTPRSNQKVNLLYQQARQSGCCVSGQPPSSTRKSSAAVTSVTMLKACNTTTQSSQKIKLSKPGLSWNTTCSISVGLVISMLKLHDSTVREKLAAYCSQAEEASEIAS